MKKWITLFLLVGSILNGFAQDTTRLSLLFLGDIMQHDSQISDAYDPIFKRYNYDPCFRFVKPYIQSADLAIGNLELTLAGPPYRGYPQFSAPDELLFALKRAGMDVLVTANNHCVDTGKKGLERTIEMLDSLHVPHTGTFVDETSKLADHPLMVEKNGFKLALLNYTYGTNGLPVTSPNIVNLIDTASMRKDILKAKSLKPDVIIVFTHWGSEYQSLPSKWQKDVTEHCFKSGAQLVIGAHPHVVQPMEWRKNKNQLIAYSLGNFVSGQRKRYTDGGAMITLELEKIASSTGTSVTRIDKANYILEWVYRTVDSEKNYYVLPVPMFETGSRGSFIKDPASKSAFGIFAEDSRTLFGKHNVNITESKEIPSDTLITYSVLYLVKTKGIDDDKLTMSVPYQATIIEQEKLSFFYSGSFLKLKEAEIYKIKLAEKFGYTNSTVVKFKDGVLHEILKSKK